MQCPFSVDVLFYVAAGTGSAVGKLSHWTGLHWVLSALGSSPALQYSQADVSVENIPSGQTSHPSLEGVGPSPAPQYSQVELPVENIPSGQTSHPSLEGGSLFRHRSTHRLSCRWRTFPRGSSGSLMILLHWSTSQRAARAA